MFSVVHESDPDGLLLPQQRRCATMGVHFRLLELYPQYRERLRVLEQRTARRLAFPPVVRETPYRIPVVVHVVYHDDADNIPDSRIDSQIAVLNEDFRAKNTDLGKVPPAWAGLVRDAMISFKLASIDPWGNPTHGITRTQTATPVFEADDQMKTAATGGADAWSTDRYLNIWVCRLTGGVLGYAQFPNGPAHTDGVVVQTAAFGTGAGTLPQFNLGRTATHEIAHFLNVHHIWADTDDCSGSDLVSDTPNAATPNTGKPVFPTISCQNGPNGDMFMNYMDYVDDDAMFMFTAGQVERMHATLDGPRAVLAR